MIARLRRHVSRALGGLWRRFVGVPLQGHPEEDLTPQRPAEPVYPSQMRDDPGERRPRSPEVRPDDPGTETFNEATGEYRPGP